jgi:hypothetical protein
MTEPDTTTMFLRTDDKAILRKLAEEWRLSLIDFALPLAAGWKMLTPEQQAHAIRAQSTQPSPQP